MLAIVVQQGNVTLDRHRPRPVRAPGEARVRVRVAGVCDTDLQLAAGYMSFCGVLGHEFVGEVVEAEDQRWLGRRVVADINAGCGTCEDCVKRDGHHCAARTVLGIAGRDGALAEELVMPERCLVEVPTGLPDDHAVFAEPLAAGAHVLEALQDVPEEPVVVLGDGKLGLLTALALRANEREVIVVGRHAEKLAIAARAGARAMLESEATAQGIRAAAVVEATGSDRGIQQAILMTRPRGTIVLKTTIAGELRLDLAPVVVNELRVIGSRCGDVRAALALLERGVDPSPLVAARFPLDRGDEAVAHAGRRGSLKVLVEAAEGDRERRQR